MKKKSKRWKGSSASRISDDRRYIESVYQKNKAQIDQGYAEFNLGSTSKGKALNSIPDAKTAFVNAMMNELHPELREINKDTTLTKSEKISQMAAEKRQRTSATTRKRVTAKLLGSNQFSTWESTEGKGIIKDLKAFGVYEEFREKTGKTKKIDFSKLTRIQGTNIYQYNYRFQGEDRVLGIKYTRSPQVIVLLDL